MLLDATAGPLRAAAATNCSFVPNRRMIVRVDTPPGRRHVLQRHLGAGTLPEDVHGGLQDPLTGELRGLRSGLHPVRPGAFMSVIVTRKFDNHNPHRSAFDSPRIRDSHGTWQPRSASTVWTGTLFEGSGEVSMDSSGLWAPIRCPGPPERRNRPARPARGTDRRGSLVLLLDGTVERTRQGRAPRHPTWKHAPTWTSNPALGSPRSACMCVATCRVSMRTGSPPPPRTPRTTAP